MLFMEGTLGGFRTGFQGQPRGNAVEPGPQSPTFPDRAGFSGKDQERRLESVFHVLRLAKEPPASPKHHRTVSPKERLERRLIALAEIAFQELAVSQAAHRLRAG